MALSTADKLVTFGLVKASVPNLSDAEFLRAIKFLATAWAAATVPATIAATLVTEVNSFRNRYPDNTDVGYINPGGSFDMEQSVAVAHQAAMLGLPSANLLGASKSSASFKIYPHGSLAAKSASSASIKLTARPPIMAASSQSSARFFVTFANGQSWA